MKSLERLAQALYLLSALGLALFCLFQSQRMSYDQRARDLATQSIHLSLPVNNPMNSSVPLEALKKKIGEESD